MVLQSSNDRELLATGVAFMRYGLLVNVPHMLRYTQYQLAAELACAPHTLALATVLHQLILPTN